MPAITPTDNPPVNTTVPISIVAWHDPIIERRPHTFRADTDHALLYWTPVIGPTGVLIMHRLARYASARTDITFTIDELASSFGVAPSRIIVNLRRLEEKFGLIVWHDNTIGVRLVLPPLSRSHLRKLPSYLAEDYLARQD
jgi:hypothetical protein